MLAKNREATIAATLDSVASFAEVILLDTGSTDATLPLAQQYPNVKIFQTEFKGFGCLRNEAAEKAQHDWILALDTDEILSPPLLQEIGSLRLDPALIYSMPRHNFYNGKWIRGCGWYPDRVARLYHRKEARYSEAKVHEVLLGRRECPLLSPLLHTPYRSTADFLAKMEHYSTLFAQQYCHQKKSSFKKALAHALFAFFRSYFLRRGLFDGAEGFTISLYNANTAFYKYLKLHEANQSS